MLSVVEVLQGHCGQVDCSTASTLKSGAGIALAKFSPSTNLVTSVVVNQKRSHSEIFDVDADIDSDETELGYNETFRYVKATHKRTSLGFR